MADKGYDSLENRDTLSRMKLKSRIMHKAQKNRRLTERETAVNKAISKVRYAVERTYGSMRRWFGAGVARYVGLAKTHAQHIMEAIAYNLYRYYVQLHQVRGNRVRKSLPNRIPYTTLCRFEAYFLHNSCVTKIQLPFCRGLILVKFIDNTKISITLSLVIIACLFCNVFVFSHKDTKHRRDYQLF